MTSEVLGLAGDRGATAHYDDPGYYSKTYERRTQDIAFYVRRAATCGGAVLEYGVGNGRVALPVARAGVDVYGVDLSQPMLADLRERLRQEPAEVRRRVRVKHGDMRKVRLKRRFALVTCPFNGVLHLYARTDMEQFLARVREHLLPGGALVLDFSVPRGADLALDPNKRFKAPRFRHPSTGELTAYAERFDYNPITQVMTTWMEFEPLEGGRPWSTPLTHRYFFPREMEALLHAGGFTQQRWSENFTDQGPSADADSLVVECRLKER